MSGEYVSAQVVADRIGATVDTVYEYAQLGRIPVAFRLGARYRFDLDAVVEALAKAQDAGQSGD